MRSPAAFEALDRAGRAGGHVVEMQRRRLLLAFTEALAEGGLEAASVGAVCARAGVSRRTFYDLFSDREACFLAALDAGVERIAAVVRPVYEQNETWREGMRAALGVLLELFDEDTALLRLCLIETAKAGPAVLAHRAELIGVLAGAVDRGRSHVRGKIAPAPLTAESIVGGAISVICARVSERDGRPLRELTNPLMSTIVQPYLGLAAAHRELERDHMPAGLSCGASRPHVLAPFRDLPIRVTFRTARVLAAIARLPGASNRQIGDASGVPDQGQISKLLNRLLDSGLIENHGGGHDSGEPNAWRLTARGQAVQQAIELPTGRARV